MKAPPKPVLIGGGLLLAAAAVYFLFLRNRGGGTAAGGPDSLPATVSTPDSTGGLGALLAALRSQPVYSSSGAGAAPASGGTAAPGGGGGDSGAGAGALFAEEAPAEVTGSDYGTGAPAALSMPTYDPSNPPYGTEVIPGSTNTVPVVISPVVDDQGNQVGQTIAHIIGGANSLGGYDPTGGYGQPVVGGVLDPNIDYTVPEVDASNIVESTAPFSIVAGDWTVPTNPDTGYAYGDVGAL